MNSYARHLSRRSIAPPLIIPPPELGLICFFDFCCCCREEDQKRGHGSDPPPSFSICLSPPIFYVLARQIRTSSPPLACIPHKSGRNGAPFVIQTKDILTVETSELLLFWRKSTYEKVDAKFFLKTQYLAPRVACLFLRRTRTDSVQKVCGGI